MEDTQKPCDCAKKIGMLLALVVIAVAVWFYTKKKGVVE
jgi:hypothetical protein